MYIGVKQSVHKTILLLSAYKKVHLRNQVSICWSHKWGSQVSKSSLCISSYYSCLVPQGWLPYINLENYRPSNSILQFAHRLYNPFASKRRRRWHRSTNKGHEERDQLGKNSKSEDDKSCIHTQQFRQFGACRRLTVNNFNARP